MAYAPATRLTAGEIPVIDIAGLRERDPDALARVAQALHAAASERGFFYVAGHGVPQPLIDDAFAVARRFFTAPLDDKQRVAIDRNHRGFLRVGEATMHSGARPDLKESYIFGREVAHDDADYLAGHPMVSPNNWPDFVPGMRETLMRYFSAVHACGESLLRAFAAGVGARDDYFVQRIDKPVSRGSLVYYPPQPAAAGEQQFGVAPHTDFGTLTLVYQDDVGGLQIRGRDGQWKTAAPIAGTFVVNVGDLLHRWSNDRFVSTPHRVVNASSRERFSIAVFVDPNWDTVIEPVCVDGEPARYPAVRCADYITGRFDNAFGYRATSQRPPAEAE